VLAETLNHAQSINLKAECGQLNLAHAARNKKGIKKKLQQTNASADLFGTV